MACAHHPLRRALVAALCSATVVTGCSHTSAKRSASRRPATSVTEAHTSTTPSLVPTTVPVRASGQTIRIGKADSGHTVAAHPGDAIVLTLDDCFSCGDHWEITTATDGNLVAHHSTDDQQVKNPPGQVGGSGTRVFTFEALRPGTTRLVLGYFPPAKGAQPDASYEVTFAVG